MPEEKKTKFCSNCGVEIDIKAKVCPKCGVEQPIIPEKVSNWWYLVPIFLGIIGGLVAWVVVRESNPKIARRLLIIGILQPIILIITWIGISATLIMIGSKEARERAREVRIISNMQMIRSIAEMVYFDEGEDYRRVNCSHSQIARACQDIRSEIGEEPIFHSTKEAYCAYIKLPLEDYFCIDSKMSARKTSVYPGQRGYCDGKTFVCP